MLHSPAVNAGRFSDGPDMHAGFMRSWDAEVAIMMTPTDEKSANREDQMGAQAAEWACGQHGTCPGDDITLCCAAVLFMEPAALVSCRR